VPDAVVLPRGEAAQLAKQPAAQLVHRLPGISQAFVFLITEEIEIPEREKKGYMVLKFSLGTTLFFCSLIANQFFLSGLDQYRTLVIL
jgi:hypothetical protein